MPPCNRSIPPLLLGILLLLPQAGWPGGAFSPGENAWDLPPLILPDLQGKMRNLYTWHGHVIVLNFWASWCAPCQVELPHLIEYQRRYGALGLQVIGVGLDAPGKLENVARTLQIPFPVLHASPDKGGLEILRRWGNPHGVLPFNVVIDRDGTILFRRIGILDEEAFESLLLPILKSKGRL